MFIFKYWLFFTLLQIQRFLKMPLSFFCVHTAKKKKKEKVL